MFGRHAAHMAWRRHSVGGTPRTCADAAVALRQWVRHGAFARTPRLKLFGANPLRTIAPESLRMMVWSFWAADARSGWVAWLRRTAALLPRPRGGQQRCMEGGSSREVVLQRVRPAGRRALSDELPPAPHMVAGARRKWLGGPPRPGTGPVCGSTTTMKARGERVLSC